MKLFDLLQATAPSSISPYSCKIHLAGWNGKEHPLDVYFRGDFDGWQAWQTKRNFHREYIISLINLDHANKWLFVGIYSSSGYEEKPYDGGKDYFYNTTPVDGYAELAGRLVVTFQRSGRASYLDAERWADSLLVSELKEEKLKIRDFPGFNKVCISKQELDTIVRQELPGWKSALSNVAGVYLITDKKNGKLYVGSACGEGGIWGRWSSYAHNGHGGNVELRHLLKSIGELHAQNFQYTILEIADTHASKDDIVSRECYWKNVFISREFGYNKN